MHESCTGNPKCKNKLSYPSMSLRRPDLTAKIHDLMLDTRDSNGDMLCHAKDSCPRNLEIIPCVNYAILPVQRKAEPVASGF